MDGFLAYFQKNILAGFYLHSDTMDTNDTNDTSATSATNLMRNALGASTGRALRVSRCLFPGETPGLATTFPGT
jgi:hypothetical protein